MYQWLSKRLRKDLRPSQSGLTPQQTILIILACSFIALVIILAGFALNRVEEKIKTDVGKALQIVQQTTRESLNLWIASNKSDLTRLAGDPRIVFLAEHQLLVPRTKDDLLKSPALNELRRFFQNNKDRFGKASYFIIAADFVNIASMGDENIGSKNRIASQALDLLNRAFKGETVMVPPIWADAVLASSSGSNFVNIPTMFFVAPIKNLPPYFSRRPSKTNAAKSLPW